MDALPIWPGALELRPEGGRPRIVGRFPYRSRATIRDRGPVRKEQVEPGAFSFTLNDPDADVHLLVGHDFGKPLASRQAGTLTLEDRKGFLEFVATIPEGAERATHVTDALAMLGAGLVKGVSPGFRVPPRDVVPDAEELVEEEGNPGVFVRVLRHLRLYELSLVTLAAYRESLAELRRADLADAERRVEARHATAAPLGIGAITSGGRRRILLP